MQAMTLESRKTANNGKPITPRAPVRSKSSPYFTPRLANNSASTPSPELRRNGPTTGATVTPRVVNGSSITPPLKTILTTNITPRSSSRKSRAGSASSTPNSTPNGTPASSRPVSFTAPYDSAQGLGGKGGIGTTSTAQPESVLSNGTNSTRNARSIEIKTLNGSNTSSMFFLASEANSVAKKPSLPARSATGFVYANGRQEDSSIKGNSPTGSNTGSQIKSRPKLYHANGHPGGHPTRTSSTNNDILPTASSTKTTPIISPRYDPKRQRSTSPLKEFEVPGRSLPSTRRASGASNTSNQSAARSSVTSKTVISPSVTAPANSRTHAKTQSMTLLETCIRPKTAANLSDPVPSSIQFNPHPPDNPSSLGFFNMQPVPLGSASTPTSPLVSPSHAGSSTGEHKIEQLNAMAANARRERKVLDLEISNSSLLAINRTLEREMRKQKAELRRFRRLTSGGRLSIIPNGRSVSGATTISTVSTLSIDSDLSFASDDDSPIDTQSEDEESGGSDDSLLLLSPEAKAIRDSQRTQRDEKRLQVDLSKHRQILIDSQRMNESLKRCLGWTDELILEGKKALEYQVRISELAMGGRVLHEDDNPELQDATPRLGLLSPTDAYLDDTDESLPITEMSAEGLSDYG